MNMFGWASLLNQGDLHHEEVSAFLSSDFESYRADPQSFEITETVFP
jgi:hypothetical protein